MRESIWLGIKCRTEGVSACTKKGVAKCGTVATSRHGAICGRLATIPEASTVHSMRRAKLRGLADIQVVRSPEQRSQRTASRFDTSWQDKQTQIV